MKKILDSIPATHSLNITEAVIFITYTHWIYTLTWLQRSWIKFYTRLEKVWVLACIDVVLLVFCFGQQLRNGILTSQNRKLQCILWHVFVSVCTCTCQACSDISRSYAAGACSLAANGLSAGRTGGYLLQALKGEKQCRCQVLNSSICKDPFPSVSMSPEMSHLSNFIYFWHRCLADKY